MTYKIQLVCYDGPDLKETHFVERPTKWATSQVMIDFLSEMKEGDFIIVTALEDQEPREFGEKK
jgi:hypothetical protein